MLAFALVSEKMFQRAEQIGAETPALRIRFVEAATGEHAGKELLRQLARRVSIASFAKEETQHGLIISLAQLA